MFNVRVPLLYGNPYNNKRGAKQKLVIVLSQRRSYMVLHISHVSGKFFVIQVIFIIVNYETLICHEFFNSPPQLMKNIVLICLFITIIFYGIVAASLYKTSLSLSTATVSLADSLLPQKDAIKTIPRIAASLSFTPATILQGDPFLVFVDGNVGISFIKKLSFDGKKIGVFMYQNKPTALVGIDLNKKPGSYELAAEFSDGDIIRQSVVVGAREKIETPLGIPEKLGGNTKASQDELVATLNEDNKSLAGIPTEDKALWTDPFIPPLEKIFVTAPYGNSRKTGAYSISHMGADYRAFGGTEVMAVNRGVVRVTQTFRNHGETIVIDHGQGVMSYYLHLSKINVKVGDVVERGQAIGLSGATGYTFGAHLHLSMRINDVSVDPVKFLKLFQ